jgi:hypothetical protein
MVVVSLYKHTRTAPLTKRSIKPVLRVFRARPSKFCTATNMAPKSAFFSHMDGDSGVRIDKTKNLAILIIWLLDLLRVCDGGHHYHHPTRNTLTTYALLPQAGGPLTIR